jgi:hypothetical protein
VKLEETKKKMGKKQQKKLKGTTLSLGELAQALGAPAGTDPMVAALPTGPRYFLLNLSHFFLVQCFFRFDLLLLF